MANGYVFKPMNAATGSAGAYVDSSWRIVLHTTETNSRPSTWIPNFQYPSHIVCSYEHQEIWQLLSFNEAGRALYHAPGGVETNRMGAIQIEINGIADEAGSWSQEKLKWLGEAVLKPIFDWIDANGGGFDCNNIPPPGPHGGSASADAPQRMTDQEWIDFNGICGHRHVPDNDHYDPDQLNVPQIVNYANSTESDDMSAQAEAQIAEILSMLKSNNNFYNTVNNADDNHVKLGIMLPQIDSLYHHVTDGNRLLQMYTFTRVTNQEQLPQVIEMLESVKLDAASIDAVVNAVVSGLNAGGVGSATPVDYDRVASIIDAALSKLVLKAS